MEPISPTPGPALEMAGQPKREAQPMVEHPVSPSPEVMPSGESREVQPAGPSNAAPSAQVLPQLPPPQPQQAPITSGGVDDNPLVAADDEVIEKEWVQKAKKVVEQTKADPHTQEKEVSKLQADYIKKRYGKEIRLTGE